MRQFFLKSSPFKLFFVLFLLPFGTQFLVMSLGALSSDIIFKLFPLTNLFFVSIVISWLYIVGTNLNKKVPKEIRKSPTIFKSGLVLSGIYCVFFSLMFAFNSSGMSKAFFLIFPIHLICMGFMFYALCFLATNYSFCIHQKRVSISERIGPFMLFWFYPAGIWALQPHIKSVFADSESQENS